MFADSLFPQLSPTAMTPAWPLWYCRETQEKNSTYPSIAERFVDVQVFLRSVHFVTTRTHKHVYRIVMRRGGSTPWTITGGPLRVFPFMSLGTRPSSTSKDIQRFLIGESELWAQRSRLPLLHKFGGRAFVSCLGWFRARLGWRVGVYGLRVVFRYTLNMRSWDGTFFYMVWGHVVIKYITAGAWRPVTRTLKIIRINRTTENCVTTSLVLYSI